MMINSMPAPISSGGGISRVVDGFKFRDGTLREELINGLIAVCMSTPQGELVHMVGPATTPYDKQPPFTLVFPDGLTPPPLNYPLQYLRNATNGGLEADSKPVNETFSSPNTTVYYDAWYLS